MSLRIVNLEAGKPTVEEARRKLIDAIEQARKDGTRALKVIHGYGSSGVGGKIRDGVRKSLSLRRKEGKIVMYVPGEKWSALETGTQELLELYTEIRRDTDLGRGNEGITIVLVK